MKHNYKDIFIKIKRMVNQDVVGRVIIAKMLAEDHGLLGTEHQMRVLVQCARDYIDPKRRATLEHIEKRAIGHLMIMAGEKVQAGKKNHFVKASAKTNAVEPIQVNEEPTVESIEEQQDVMVTVNDLPLEDQLRERYDIQDKNWVPVAVWGDMRNPMVKWERKRSSVRHEEYLQRIELRELPHSVDLPVDKNRVDEDRIAVLSIRDAHFGLLTEHPMPYEKYDLNEASDATVKAGGYLMVAAAANGVTKLVIPIGSDLLHVDGNSNATTKGTRQDTNSFWWEAFDAAINAMNQIINAAKDTFDQVIIPIEPGNHDASLSRAVGIAMKSAWSNQSNVSILDNPETLKRVSFGNTHLFMHHGNSLKPALLQSWVYAKHSDVIKPGSYVEVLCGHYHHRSLKKLREPGDYFEFGGIMIRITPALCPASNWSESQGYVSSPGAQLTIYDEIGFVSLHEWTPNRT